MLREQLVDIIGWLEDQTFVHSGVMIDMLQGIVDELNETEEFMKMKRISRITELRAIWKDLSGKDAFMGWGEAELDRKIEDFKSKKEVEEKELAFSSGDEVNEMLELMKKANKKVKDDGEPKSLRVKKNGWKKAMRK